MHAWFRWFLLALLPIGLSAVAAPAARAAECGGDPEIDAIVCADLELKSLHDQLLDLVGKQMRYDMMAYAGYEFYLTKRDKACGSAADRKTCLKDWYQKRVAAMPGEIEADKQQLEAILNPPDVWFTPHAGIKGWFSAGRSDDPKQQEINRFDVAPMALACSGGYAGGLFCRFAAALELETTIERSFNAKGTCTLEMLVIADGDPYPVTFKHDFEFDWNDEGLRATKSFPFIFSPTLGYGAQPVLDAKLTGYRCLITHIL